jgi:hypothetical protein
MESLKESSMVKESPWVDFVQLVADCIASHKEQGLLHNAVHEETIRSVMAKGYGSVATIAEAVGGRMEFQNCSPPGDPKSVVRCRFLPAGAEPMLFEGFYEFGLWVRSNRPWLLALAAKHDIAMACQPTASENPSRRRGL